MASTSQVHVAASLERRREWEHGGDLDGDTHPDDGHNNSCQRPKDELDDDDDEQQWHSGKNYN